MLFRSDADFVVGHPLEHFHHRGIVEPVFASGAVGIEQFLAQRGARQRHLQSARARQDDVEILLMKLHAEAGIEGPLEHALAVHFENA